MGLRSLVIIALGSILITGCGSTTPAQPPATSSLHAEATTPSIEETVDPFVLDMHRAVLVSPRELVALFGDREMVQDDSAVVRDSALLTFPANSLDHLEVIVAVESERGLYLAWRNQWGDTLFRTRPIERSALLDAVRRLASRGGTHIEPESR